MKIIQVLIIELKTFIMSHLKNVEQEIPKENFYDQSKPSKSKMQPNQNFRQLPEKLELTQPKRLNIIINNFMWNLNIPNVN